METIKLYGQTYTKNYSTLVDTLFNANIMGQGCPTANGIFKRYKNRIELTHTSGEVVAVVRCKGGAVVLSTKSKDGRFMHSTSSKADKLFGVPDSFMEMNEQADELLQTFDL